MRTRPVSIILSVLLGFILIGFVFFAWKEYRVARVVVAWSTASELDTVGFNIYRSDTPTDPGILVNVDLIPASDDAQTGGDYRYTDKDIVPGRVYYYYLEDVNTHGVKNRHGPVEVKAQANGNIVWILLIILAVVALFGSVIIAWPRRKTG